LHQYHQPAGNKDDGNEHLNQSETLFHISLTLTIPVLCDRSTDECHSRSECGRIRVE
jgi:hypothetical protein